MSHALHATGAAAPMHPHGCPSPSRTRLRTRPHNARCHTLDHTRIMVTRIMVTCPTAIRRVLRRPGRSAASTDWAGGPAAGPDGGGAAGHHQRHRCNRLPGDPDSQRREWCGYGTSSVCYVMIPSYHITRTNAARVSGKPRMSSTRGVQGLDGASGFHSSCRSTRA